MTQRTLSAAAAAASLVVASACGGGQPNVPPEVPEVPAAASEGDHKASIPREGAETDQMPQAGAPRESGADESPASRAAASVSEEEVEAFSDLQVQMFGVVEDLHARAIQGEDPAALEAELEQEATKLVEESSLSVPRFQEIAILVLEVPELRARVEESVREKVERPQTL